MNSPGSVPSGRQTRTAAQQRLEEVPLECNGSVRRSTAAQPAPDSPRPEPQGDVEQRLCRIFEDLFCKSPCGAGDDFFELGGDSLMALNLLARVDREFGIRFPYEVLLERPTVRRLGQWLSATDSSDIAEPLVSIRPGVGAPVFCLPGIDGVLMGYRRLAEALDCKRPVFGLQPLKLSQDDRNSGSLEDAAARLMDVVRRVQPQGPHHLVGYSLGGALAWEMARLAAAGGTAGLLVLLDTPRVIQPASILSFADRVRLHWRNLRSGRSRGGLGYVAERLRVVAARSRRYLRRSASPAKEFDDLVAALGLPPAQRAMAQRLRTWLLDYRPQPYAHGLLLFRAMERPEYAAGQSDETGLGWNGWAHGGVEEHMVPGTHLEILHPPAIDTIAQVLSRRLASAG